MADRKITELSSMSAGGQATGDLVTIVDVSEAAAADKNKKMTMENLFKGIPSNVGVGTSSPDSTLELASGPPRLKLTRNTTANTGNDFGRIVFENSAGTEVSRIDSTSTSGNTTPALKFSNNGSERFRVDSSGRFLVGTTSSIESSSVIQAVSASNSTVIIGNTNTSASGEAVINFAPSNSIAGGQIKCIAEEDFSTGANRTAFLQFNTRKDGTFIDAMRIDSSGRLLLGTSASSAAASIIAEGNSSNAAGAGVIYLNRGTGSMSNGLEMGFIRFGDQDENTGALIQAEAAGTWASNDYPGRLIFSTTASGASSPTERLRIDSSGNSIQYSTGTLNRQHRQQSSSVYTATNIRSVISGAAGYLAFDTNTNWTNGNAVERMRIDSSGRLLLGTSSSIRANAILQIKDDTGQTEVWLEHNNLADNEFNRYIAVDDTANRSGQVGIYKHASIVNPTAFVYLQCNDGADRWYWTDNVDVLRSSATANHIGTTNGSVVGTQTSDLRLKNVGANVAYGLAEVKQLQPKQYALKGDPDVNKLGFIAQEVESIIPESVYDTGEELDGHQEGDRTKLGMEYVQLIPVLVNAIKELSAEVDTLKTKVAALEAQ